MENLSPTPRQLLLIDDDEDLREIFAATLQAIGGIDTLLADSAAAGLALALNQPVDLILMDVMMPQMGGQEAFRRFRSNPSTMETPVVFMTARTDADHLQSLHELGCAAVISKACTPSQFAAQVVQILNQIESS